jgi:hypothetical protein
MFHVASPSVRKLYQAVGSFDAVAIAAGEVAFARAKRAITASISASLHPLRWISNSVTHPPRQATATNATSWFMELTIARSREGSRALASP